MPYQLLIFYYCIILSLFGGSVSLLSRNSVWCWELGVAGPARFLPPMGFDTIRCPSRWHEWFSLLYCSIHDFHSLHMAIIGPYTCTSKNNHCGKWLLFNTGRFVEGIPLLEAWCIIHTTMMKPYIYPKNPSWSSGLGPPHCRVSSSTRKYECEVLHLVP